MQRDFTDHDKDGYPIFRPGYIQELKVSVYMTDEGPVAFFTHVIVFNDDTTRDYILVNLEEENRIKWSADDILSPQVIPYSLGNPFVCA